MVLNVIWPRFGEEKRTDVTLSGTFKDSENRGYVCNPLLFCLLAKSAVYHKVCEICDKNMWKSICTDTMV